MTLHPGSRFGSYEILFPLGAGGMGQVFAARDSRLGRKVALKILPAPSMERIKRVRRFEQEARAASALNHPNILTVFEIGECNGIHYMATELVEGQTLRSMLKEPKPLALSKALDIAVQATGALSVAHAEGIVHRDIKPENIMVRPDGYVKVLDFGLAKLTEAQTQTALPSDLDPTMPSALTQPGQVIGTYRYMSPEQARGLEVDGRSDIWSFGTVLYEMVTGTSPFAAPTATDTLARILERQPAPVVEITRGAAPPELQRILARALAKDREERYHSMKDFELDLRQLQRTLMGSGGIPVAQSVPVEAPASTEKTKMGRSMVFALIAILIIAAVATIYWKRQSKSQPAAAPPLPERELTYRLHAQKLRNGKPFGEEFLASPEQVFDSDWRIRLDFISPEAGSLYVLDREKKSSGSEELSLFFPLPGTNQGVAQVAANQRVATDWARFEQQPGTEEFLIFWSGQPLPEMEQTILAVSNPQAMGIIRDPQRVSEIESLFQKNQAAITKTLPDKDLRAITVNGRGEILVTELSLEHR